MIDREEAKELSMIGMTVDKYKGVILTEKSYHTLIDIIYSSIGSCRECNHGVDFGDEFIHCNLFKYSMREDWYCADFEEKKED